MSNRDADSAKDGRRTSRELVEEARAEGVDATPNDQLRELVERWRNHEHMSVYIRCANELEEVIEDG